MMIGDKEESTTREAERGGFMNEVLGGSSIPTRILVPIDFSESSHAALMTAADLAQHFHAELYLVHILPIFPRTTFPDFLPEANFLDKVRKDAEERFAVCQTDLDAKGIKVNSSIEEGNDVAEDIIEVIEREKIDFVVISTHGMTGWHPIAFGSIAEKIVKMVQCPLLLLRTAKPASSVKHTSERLMEWW
ncbi:MAG: universal stress protein [Terracidiphilus sp.]